MNKTVLTIIVTVLIFALKSGSFGLEKAQEEDAFRGIKWGSEITTIIDSNLALEVDKGAEKFYTRKTDSLELKTVEVSAIRYGFYEGKFYTVLIPYEKRENFEKLKEALALELGEGERTFVKNFFEQYDWKGQKVSIKLYYSFRADGGRVTYFYDPVFKVKEANEEEKRREEKIRQEKEASQRRFQQYPEMHGQ